MCDQLVLSSQSSWSQIGWHQGGVLCITNLLVSISLGSTCSWAADSYLLPPGGGLSLQNSAKDTAQRMTFRP